MTKAPEIEFPCRYPIKVIAVAQPNVQAEVIDIVRRHANDLTPDYVSTRHSSGAKFVALRINLMAQGPEQLQAMYDELMQQPTVRMVF